MPAPNVHADRHQTGGPDPLQGTLDIVAKYQTKHGGVLIGTRHALNIIDGHGMDITVADDSGNDEVDATFDVDETEFTYSIIATALAGNGLDVSGSTLVVDPEEFTPAMAGHALDDNGDLLDVDETEFTYSIIATALAGSGLDVSGSTLVVDGTEVNGWDDSRWYFAR